MPDHSHDQRDAESSVITLSTPVVEQIGLDRARVLADALARLAADRLEPEQIDDELQRIFDREGIQQPEVVVGNLADRLYNAGEITVITNDGHVLHGDPSFDPSTAIPDNQGTDDPEHGDRPTYS